MLSKEKTGERCRRLGGVWVTMHTDVAGGQVSAHYGCGLARCFVTYGGTIKYSVQPQETNPPGGYV